MTVVTGTLAAVNAIPTTGTLTVRSLTLRPGGMAVVTGEPKIEPIIDGSFEIELIPGMCQFTIAGDGASHDVTYPVPDEESVDFIDLIEDNYDWEPPVVQAAQQAARDAARAAREAVEAAAIVGSAQRVLEAEKASADSAAEAARQAVTAGQHKDKAAEHLTNTQTARTDAGRYRNEAEGFRNEAEGFKNDAQESATASDSSAKASDSSEKLAADHAKQTTEDVATSLEHRTMTGRARNEAQTARTQAQQAREDAIQASGSASSSAQEAASDVRDELQDISQTTADSATAAKTSEDNAKISEQNAAQSEKNAAEVVSSGVADATPTIKGKLQLAGDLAGTADAPTVPGLSGKANATHTHDIDDVTGLRSTVNAVDAATHAATPSTLMRRGTGAAVSVGTPTSAVHAATKQYVDDVAEQKMDGAKIQVVASLPSKPDPDTIYLVTG